ncbi:MULTISPECIES: LexA family protein [unclassified Vibrio]|uniref:LexA family protein n=1 Tax=unclassified Vibrio TaxID=2614977 RepID=UPI001360EBDA|nr:MULTISPECIES: LexA family transcriptional regulator [unclassified Vibrio]NAW57864.1 helix-turn-helix domain-containing protein [Vibrio sp. V36_P2S2PM302]NAX26553.1 helix-turn-helix domain-containing protein [Vibrio sp. V38_P2S17PM301]NAX31496.1 helix-turn-helix domain-containing protein [Vibrio sp. V37_P2S8PM304]
MVQNQKLREEFAARLAQACEMAGIKKWGRATKLAKLAHVSQKAAHKWLTGETLPRQESITLLAKQLNVDGVWLQHGERANAKEPACYARTEYVGSHPVLGKVSAGKFESAIQMEGLLEMTTTIRASTDSFWLVVDGNSMTAPIGISFPDGMLILVDPLADYQNNDFVVAYTENRTFATFKKLTIEPEGWFLNPLNPDPFYKRIHFDESNCEIVGRVVDARWSLR